VAHVAPGGATNRRSWALIGLAALLGTPGIVLRVLQLGADLHIEPIVASSIFGLSIVAAAFLITWVAEAAEVEIAQSLALALVALIAVLPEYAVDLTFAWKAGDDPVYAQYAAANMTGGNRLLVGFAWPLVVFVTWYKTRRKVLRVNRSISLELAFLGIATVYSFLIPLKGNISLIDTVVLVSLFGAYIVMAGRGHQTEPEIVEPALSIARLPKARRRQALAAIFVYAAVVIGLAAEPFAEGLVETGRSFDIDEFLLVQWLAPLASEAPEIVIATILALRGRASQAMGALISSKVNQWTLLIGTLPVAYAASNGSLAALPLDDRQAEEVFLTAAQSAFAVAIFVSLSISLHEAGVLFLLFVTQLFLTSETIRIGYAFVYLALALLIAGRDRTELAASAATVRSMFRGVNVDAEPDAARAPPQRE
jgi:cation:H+ antiporter